MAGDPILIVDDNEDLGENIAELLGLEGFAATHFADPRAALAWAEGNAFALALLDVRMPFMDGPTLYERLRAVRPRARYAFVTAFDDANTHALAQREGLEVITKPFAENELLASVRALVGDGT